MKSFYEIRNEYKTIGELMSRNVWTDDELKTIIMSLDMVIGIHDGYEGFRSLTSYALIALQDNFIRVARLRDSMKSWYHNYCERTSTQLAAEHGGSLKCK